MRVWMNLFETLEASPDEVHEIVEAFEKAVEDDEICNEVYSEHHGDYIHLFLGGYPEDGFDEAKGREYATALNEKMKPMGWFVSKCDFKLYDDAFDESDPEGASSQLMCFIDVFPLHGERHEIEDVVYHVCRAEDVEAIKRHGLEPRTGGNDHIQTANGRVYVCTHKMFLWRIENDFVKLRGWRDLHVFAIYTEGLDNDWYQDVEMGGAAAWTPQPIPPQAMHHLGKLADHVIY